MAGRRARAARSAPPARSQHFLRSPRLAADLVRDAGIEEGDLVVDLGAGNGRLTCALARAGARVLAVEIDASLAAGLQRLGSGVEVVCGDATTFPLPGEPFRVLANLPFHATTAILRRLADPATPLIRADVVVEWAVAAKRAAVWPSTSLGVRWAAYHHLFVARHLDSSAFSPQPAVAAGVLVIERRARPLVPRERSREFSTFVRRGFERGPRSVVPARTLKRIADRHGFGRDAAARDLDVIQWAALFAASRLAAD